MVFQNSISKGIKLVGVGVMIIAAITLVGCGGGGKSSTASSSNGTSPNASAALYNTQLTGVGAVGSYTITTRRTSSGVTQNGITKANVILPANQAAFCSDEAVHNSVTQTIGFMGSLQITSCSFSGSTGQIDMLIDLGIGQGYTTAGSVSFSYAQSSGGASNPGITGVLPTSAAVGSWVTISGTNFTQAVGNYRISFNGVNATPISRTLYQLAVYVPAGATSGPLTVTDLTTNTTYTVTNAFTVTGAVSSVSGAGPMAGTWTYTSPAGVAWSVVTDATVPNAGAVYQSSTITHSQSTSAQTSITMASAGNVSFYYKVSSEANWDKLNFYVDNVLTASWSGTVPWTLATYPLTSGVHTLKWTYIKDSSASVGLDSAWVSQVSTVGGGSVATPTIAGLIPSSAYPGDYVTIMGAGLTKATSAYSINFNGIPAVVVTRNMAGDLVAQVPVGATSGVVSVTDIAALQTYSAPAIFTVWTAVFVAIPAGGAFTDAANDVATDFVDMTGATLIIDATNITLDLSLRNLPATFAFNQNGVPVNFLEYEWAVEFDVNNDGVADYTLSASKYKFSATPTTGSLLSNIQADVWSAAGASLAAVTPTLIGTTGLRLTVPISANAALGNITANSKVRFTTYYRSGAATSVSDSM